MSSEPSTPAPIAAIRGGPGSVAAAVLAAFALRRREEGVAVAGVVDPPGESGHGGHRGHGGRHGHGDHMACGCSGVLLDLATGETIGIHQDLGPGSDACNLDTSALARACGAIERAIADGADLVVLRFTGQEAARGGLSAAFQAAMAAALPVACIVGPKAETVWERFAEGLSVWLPAEAEALDAWWRGHAGAPRQVA
jgi:hypothetical protein